MFEPRRIYNWDGDNMDLIKELLEVDILHVGFEVTEEVVDKIADISLEKKLQKIS